MDRTALASLLLAALALASRAPASTIFGNPVLNVVLASGPDVELLGLRGYTCPGQVTDDIGAMLSTSAPLTGELPADDYCGLAVGVRWEETEPGETVPVDGFDALTLASGEVTRTITLDPTTRTATLE